ncbi:MAG: EexN family lipoprotein [Desulfobulbaceae bacterium]|nr:EexN family lipoprotein [Desulfobulbaceae bacterium]
MTRTRIPLILCGLTLITACSEEPQPRSVAEFLEDPIVLEAAVVRCSHNRNETRYDAECVNVRQAISIIEAKEERARRAAFEMESEGKREALRQTQEDAAEALRRATEQERLRREAEYLAQFGELPPTPEGETAAEGGSGNAPTILIPEPVDEDQVLSELVDSPPASDGGNAPLMELEPESDPDAIREELRLRSEEPGTQD